MKVLSNILVKAGLVVEKFTSLKGASADYLTFNTLPSASSALQGTVYWDPSHETAALIMNGTVQHVGQDTFYHVKNSTGSTIPKGTAVRFAGTDGNSGHLLIAPFIANGSTPSNYFMGVTSEPITNGGFGKVMHFGNLDGVNTSAYQNGDILYASTTVAGGFQTTVPVAPNNIITIAAVVSAGNNGKIAVRPALGSNINNDEGVRIVSPQDNQVLSYNSSLGLWQNAAVVSNNIYNSNGTISAARTVTVTGSLGFVRSNAGVTATFINNDDNYNAAVAIQNNSTASTALTALQFNDRTGAVRANFGYYPDTFFNVPLRNALYFANVYEGIVFTANSGAVGGVGKNIIFQTIGTPATDQMRIFGSTGNVAINNNTDAGYKLDVQGTARIGNNLDAVQLTVNGSVSSNGIFTSAPLSFNGVNRIIYSNGLIFSTNNSLGNSTRSYWEFTTQTPVADSGVGGIVDLVKLTMPVNNGTQSADSRALVIDFNVTTNLGVLTAIDAVTGKIRLRDLSGTGSRMVVADATGVLSTAALPTSTNIYNSDGTLTGARILTLGGSTLDIVGSTTTRFFANGRVGIGTTTDGGFQFEVNGASKLGGVIYQGRAISIAPNSFNKTFSNGTSVVIGDQTTAGQLNDANILIGYDAGKNLNSTNTGQAASNIIIGREAAANTLTIGVKNIIIGKYMGSSLWFPMASGDSYKLLIGNIEGSGGGTLISGDMLQGSMWINPTTTNFSSPDTSVAFGINSTIVGIGSSTAHKGFLPPTMTNAQRTGIGTPAIGLQVYATDATEGQYVNLSTGWNRFLTTADIGTVITSTNIYNSDGTLSGARVLTLGGNPLDIAGTTTTRFFANGAVGIGTTTDGGFLFDVNGTARLGANSVIGGGSAIGGINVTINGDTRIGGLLYLVTPRIFLSAANADLFREESGNFVYRFLNTGSLYIGAGSISSTGQYNIAIGGGGSGAGSNNVTLGVTGLSNLTTGSNNTAVGQAALYNVTTNSDNVGIGRYAGTSTGNNTNANHSQSIFIGSGTGWATNGTPLTNTTIIGTNLRTDLSNVVMLGRTDQNVLIGAPSTNAGFKLDVNGTLRSNTLTVTSTGNSVNIPSGGRIFYGNREVTIGENSVAGYESVAIGWNSGAVGKSIVIGKNLSSATFGNCVMIGGTDGSVVATDTGTISIASSTASGIGIGGFSNHNRGIAIGNSAQALNAAFEGNMSIGLGCVADGVYSVALGSYSEASANEFVVGARDKPVTNVYFGGGFRSLSRGNGSGPSYTINGSAALGTDFAGGNVTIAGGRGTGTGVSGNVIFSTASTTTTGTTLQTLTERMRVFGTTGNVLIQNGGTFTDAGFRLDVNGTARINGAGETTINSNDVTSISWFGTKIFKVAGGITASRDGTTVRSGPFFSIINNNGTAPCLHIEKNVAGTNVSGIQLATDLAFSAAMIWSRYSLHDFVISSGNTTTENASVLYANGAGAWSFSNGVATPVTVASAILALNTTTRGFLPPRMTAAQRTAIGTPAVGLVVYQTDGTEGLYENTSTGWRVVNAAGTGGGSGTVTSVSVVSANGFAGTVATSTTTPAITISTTVTGLVKGNGTAISAAVAGTDYLTPSDVAYAVASVSSTYSETATAGTKIIKANTSGGAFSVTLPTAVGNKAVLVIKKAAGSPDLTIDGAGSETIDGSLTAIIRRVDESITLVSDNSNWLII